MARQRTTYDTWECHVNYGHGWECEHTVHSREGKIESNREYTENCTFPHKWKKVRVPMNTLQPGQWEGIQRDIVKEKEYHKQMKAKRKAAKLVVN